MTSLPRKQVALLADAILLFLFLLVVLSTYKRYAEWDYFKSPLAFADTRYYRQANAQLPPASPTRVVMFGDSITAQWQRFNPEVFRAHPDLIDRGVPGETTQNMLLRFRQDALDLHPAGLHILAGINDIAGLTGPETNADILANIATMVELAQAHHINVVLASVLPCSDLPWAPEMHPSQRILQLNRALRALAEQRNIPFVDYYSVLATPQQGMPNGMTTDGLHPNREGYLKIDPLFLDALDRLQPGSTSAAAPETAP